MNFKTLIPAYIEHLKKGFSENSFDLCDYTQLEEFAEKENLIAKINLAKRSSQKFWEYLAIKSLTEDYRHFRYELWIFVMKSRFGWTDEPKPEPGNKEKIVEVQLMLNPNQKLSGNDDNDSNEYHINNS